MDEEATWLPWLLLVVLEGNRGFDRVPEVLNDIAGCPPIASGTTWNVAVFTG